MTWLKINLHYILNYFWNSSISCGTSGIKAAANLLTNNYNTHLPNISRSKGNQTMKYEQVIKYNNRNIFLQKSCRRWGKELVPDLFLFKKKRKKTLYEAKASCMQLSSDIFGWSSTQQTIKTKSINFRLLILSYAQFAIFGKESGNSFSTTFCVNFF